MRARKFTPIVVSSSLLLFFAGTPSMAQVMTAPVTGGMNLGGAAAAVGSVSLPAPSLSPSLSIAAPMLAASLPAAPAAFAAFAAAPAAAAIAAASVPDFAAPSGPNHTLTGDVRFIRDFHSDALGNSRTVAVYLPPGYESSNARYPVLYMQDGQNLFDAATAYGGNEWEIDETCERLMRSGELPPFIVVAVYSTNDRIPEYTPVPDPGYGGGRGDLYAKFLIDELKPYVDANLRTLPGAENTGLMGSSLGGLISLHLGLGRPDVFSRIGALSPSLWWADGELTKRLAASPPPEERARVWLDMGTREGDNPGQRVADTRELGGVLQARGWREGDDLAVRVIDGAGHNEASWRERAAEVLKFLFPARPRP
jgi:predicted alpha/beta superfamily hydrolase